MTVTYVNGRTIKAALVVRTDKSIRVVLAGTDDVTEFTQINGAWVSEDCDPVHIEFGGPRRTTRQYTEEDFACSKELAARLIHMLLNPEEDEDLSTPIPSPSLDSTADRLVV